MYRYKKLSDLQLKAAILVFLLKKGRWGGYYFPLDTLVNWFGKKVRNGKRIEKIVKDLVNERYLTLYKRGATVSLNPARSEEIVDFIKRVEIESE
jgi:hypothetical protein